jgi:hypothetical protein
MFRENKRSRFRVRQTDRASLKLCEDALSGGRAYSEIDNGSPLKFENGAHIEVIGSK